jgi:curved DNA-binding protein CbpA
MKKIDDYRKLLGVNRNSDLKEMKSVYRGLMKDWHPDKFQDSDESREAAEEKSKGIIEAYHFLVSISPETAAQMMPEYLETINSNIADFNYKGQTLTIEFVDGNSYEYFDVPKSIYVKLINADSQNRFARRQICTSFVYRCVGKAVMA